MVSIGTVSIGLRSNRRKMTPSSGETWLPMQGRLMVRGRRGDARGQEEAGNDQQASARGCHGCFWCTTT